MVELVLILLTVVDLVLGITLAGGVAHGMVWYGMVWYGRGL